MAIQDVLSSGSIFFTAAVALCCSLYLVQLLMDGRHSTAFRASHCRARCRTMIIYLLCLAAVMAVLLLVGIPVLPWVLVTVLLGVMLAGMVWHVFITRRLLGEGFTLLTGTEEIWENEVPQAAGPSAARHPTPLTRKDFEQYFRTHKPYLDPSCTLTGLAEALGTNRVTLSKFVNTNYGQSFTAYVNDWRLHEFDRLAALKANRNVPAKRLFARAGFGSYHSYLRARQAANGAAGAKPSNEKEGGHE